MLGWTHCWGEKYCSKKREGSSARWALCLVVDYRPAPSNHGMQQIPAPEFAVIELNFAIGVHGIPDGISQRLLVVVNSGFRFFADTLVIVSLPVTIFRKVLVEAALLQVELVNKEASLCVGIEDAVIDCTMYDGCGIIRMLLLYEFVESVDDSLEVCCKWSVFNQFGRAFLF